MKATFGIAALLFVWIIIAFILNSLAGFSVLNQHILTLSSLGSLGVVISYTVQYIVEVAIIFIVLISYSLYPNIRLNIALLVVLEAVAILYSVGAVA